MNGGKTIEAIAVGIGTRRSGRNLTLRLREHDNELNELIAPTHPREWNSSLKESFKDPEALKILIEDIRRLDTELTKNINEDPLSYAASSPSLQSNILKYQEYVDVFVGIFAHFTSKDVEGDRILGALKSQRCPAEDIFSRLVVNPNYIVYEDATAADSHSELNEMPDSEGKKIPLVQLARICDVSVLRFLGNVTEKTPPPAIQWALDYIFGMTKRIGDSLKDHSESGWYGLTFRKRKSTIRNSTTEVPKLALDGRPMVIAVGLPDQFVSPETGEIRGNSSLPSISISDHEPDVISPQHQLNRNFSGSSIQSNLSESSIHIEVPSMEERKSPTPTLPELRKFGTRSPIGIGLEEKEIGQQQQQQPQGRQRRHSVATKPALHSILLEVGNTEPQQQQPKQRRVSTGSRPSGVGGVPMFSKPKRKTSIVDPVKAVIESIHEESAEEPTTTTITVPSRPTVSPPPLPQLPIPTTSTTPPSPPSQLQRAAFSSPDALVSSLDRNIQRTTNPRPTSPLTQSLSRPISPQSEKSDDQSGDSDTGADPDVSVRYKPKSRGIQFNGPPHLPSYTAETLQTELHTLITHNGRISLLAILTTISKLPSNPQLWTEDNWDACKVCISLIQFCVDFGLDTEKKNNMSDQSPLQRRRVVRSDPRVEKPSTTYSKLILKYSLKALIHCAVSTYTGCLIDRCRVNTCYSKNASQNLNKMMHQLERLYSNSPLLFRESIIEFTNSSPLKRIFHFLHVILQYCPRGSSRDPLDPSFSRRDTLIVLSATVLRIVVDRMMLLDLSEPFIQNSVVKEAIAFIHFSHTLFSQEFLRSKGFSHLQWYVNRVALSILLPMRGGGSGPSSSIPTFTIGGVPLDELTDSGTFPRRSGKKRSSSATPVMDAGTDEMQKQRKRGYTYHGPTFDGSQSPVPSHKSPSSSRKAKLVKQSSLHSDLDHPEGSANTASNNDHIIKALQKEWRGLHLGILHQRVRRLSIMMDLTEPGIIPDASLLASLIAVGPPGSLVPRVLVLLECALFVHKLNKEEMTVWMKNQPSRYLGNWELFRTLKGWGEAIGEALSACEITEKELFTKAAANSDSDGISLAEEPIFNDEERDSEKRYIVNYSLKMVAVTLLTEITKFCREPPHSFLPVSPPSFPLKRSTSSQSQERKPSNISVMSSDSDTNPSPTPSFSQHQARQGSLDYTRKGSSPLLDSATRFLSIDHPPSPNTGSRVSMFLRVNSRHGKKHPRTNSYTIQNPGRPKSHLMQVEAPQDTFQVVAPSVPSKTTRRLSVSANTYLSQLNTAAGDTHGANIRHRAGPSSMSINANAIRRKSVSGTVLKSSGRRLNNSNNSPILTHLDSVPSRGSIQAITMTPPASQKLSSPQPISRRPSMFGRMFQRRPRRRQNNSENTTGSQHRGRLSTTTNASSANSSPCLTRQKSAPQTRADTIYDSTLEDIKSNFPWLDVVEHMIVSFYSTSTEFQDKRKRSCCELMLALKHIFSMKFEKEETANTTPANQPSASNDQSTLPKTIDTSLSAAFTNATLIPDASPSDMTSVTGTPRTMRSILRPKQVSSNEMPRSLSKLDFSGVRLRRFLESGMSWGLSSGGNDNVSLKDLLGDDKDNLHTSIDYLLETDSSLSLDELMEAFNTERLQYVSTFFVGLLHAPFSLLTYAAPVLPPPTFRDLQESSWIALIDQDYEYADAAASFFLLCCVKEKEHMFSFLKSKAKTNHPVAVRDAVTRFEILWRCRDGVWSRMEQSAPKLFKLEEETGDSIGYSLPSQLLGIPGENLPYAPWKPVSVCSKDHTKENVQCYQGTKRAPLEHLQNVVKSTRAFPVSGSSVVQMEVDTAPAVVNSNALFELEYEQGRIKVKDVYKLSTVFPNDLLPLITMVIKALEPPYTFTSVLLKADSDTSIPTITQISSMAEHLLWSCMLDNPYYLFSPLLNQFNVLYKVVKDNKRKPKLTVEECAAEILEGILKPFHILLSHFPSLPPKASHMLFNNFIGIIMRHTEQPVLMSDVVIHSVLTLLKMVVPSMKGLTMKELKNQLKKESCYTTVLTTARIRGVEKIKIKWECQPDREVIDIAVQEENLKFIDLIHRENLSAEDEPENSFSMWYSHYLTEEKTNRKVLNSLVVQDHYPATADGSTPVFILHKSASTKQAMKDQQELLHIHKMTELARVMFTIQMMKADSSATLGLQQEFAQPNPTFVISELQGLNSFPRKTLSSLLDEVGVAGLHEWQLRMVDIMLRGVWSKFILNLFIKVNDYQPSDNVILFLTVVNGSLLLQAEDSSTLRYCLATLLVAAKKFESIFRQNAYQMIIPMLLRVYSLHSRNKMVKDAIKFLWTCFYSLGKNTFLLQAVVSVANLFSQEVNGIASKMKVNYCPLCIDWQAEEQTTIVKSVVELIETLDCTDEKNLPPDHLDILGACPEETELRSLRNHWTGCSFEQVVPFCVTVASFNPEVLRGMQVLVFLDHLMVQLIKVYTTNKKNSFIQIATSIRSLIKGCESLKRSIKSTTSSKGPQIQQQPSSNMDDNFDTLTNKPRSSFIKEMFHRNRSGTSQSLQMMRERSISELSSDDMGRAKYIDGFRSRSLQNISQQIVTLSRDSLLSIAAQLITHAPNEETAVSKNPFDSASLMNICSITEKVLRIASKTNQDLLLESKGVAAVFNDLLPKVVWDQDNVSSFLLIVERLFKIFRKLQAEHSHPSSVPWTDLTKFIKCIQLCVHKCPILVTDNDQILSKIRGIMEICLNTSSTTTNKKRTTYYFIQDAAAEFVATFVELCTEMIVRTNGQSNKQRVRLSSLFANALDFKHSESSSVWEKMFLPLTVNLGVRDSSCLSSSDISFVVENILNMSEHIRVVIERVKASSQKDQIRRYFISMKVILAAYCDNFTQEQWITIGYCFLASTSKFDKDSDNELYFEFCLEFLNFWETFVVPSRLPIFSILWHVVATIEGQMSLVLRNNSSLLEKLSGCLHKCKDILRSSLLFNVSLSKQELLICLQQELQFNTGSFGERSQRRSFASNFYPGGMPLELPIPRGSDVTAGLTTASTQQLSWAASVSQPSTLKCKNSKAPGFPAIQETAEADTSGLPSPDGGLVMVIHNKGGETSMDMDEIISPIESKEPSLPPATIRPTTLSFKPSTVEKTQKQETKKGSTTSSPKISKPSRPSVSFSDKISEQSPPAKKIFGSSFASKRSKTSSPIAEKQHVPAKKVYKQPKRNSERRHGRKPESGFEADEEDASLETPKSSVSFPTSPYTALNLPSITMKPSPLATKGESLVIAAEIHDEVTLSSSEDSNHSDDTCLESSDNESKTIKTQTSLNTAKNKPSDHLTRNTRATYHGHGSPSAARRNMFKASKNVNIEFEEQPDEETGQISHQRHREQPSDSPTLAVVKQHQNTLNESPQTRRNSNSSKSTKMYNTGVNQASGFIGEIEWPLDDDCSV